ncbi:MAG: PIN domain-containing protein [Acidimicrobiales bacterium]
MIVVDSGVLIATADVDDRHHLRCTQLLDARGHEFVVPAPVVVEVCWMLGRHVSIDLEADFLASLADNELRVESLDGFDYGRMAELVDAYRNLPLGAVDAAVVAVAERLGIITLATIDRRDFSVVRPRHVDNFELVPELTAER